jgi:hypothetical protein
MTPEEKARFEKELNDVLFTSVRKFADKINFYFAEGYFALRVYSGEQFETYILTPQHAKRLMSVISSQIGNYEGAFGEIKLMSAPPTLSPIQLNDQKPPEEGEEPKK